jgi:hypothetical protein
MRVIAGRAKFWRKNETKCERVTGTKEIFVFYAKEDE